MGETRLFSRDEDGTEIWLEKIDEDTMIQHTVVNPDAIFELNKQRRAMFDRTAKLYSMHLIAEIPPDIYWELHSRGIVQDRDYFRKWLDRPENIAYRTNDIKLGKRSR